MIRPTSITTIRLHMSSDNSFSPMNLINLIEFKGTVKSLKEELRLEILKVSTTQTKKLS